MRGAATKAIVPVAADDFLDARAAAVLAEETPIMRAPTEAATAVLAEGEADTPHAERRASRNPHETFSSRLSREERNSPNAGMRSRRSLGLIHERRTARMLTDPCTIPVTGKLARSSFALAPRTERRGR